MKKSSLMAFVSIVAVSALAILGAGCPPIGPDESAKVITVLSGDDDITKAAPLYVETKQGPLPVSEIEAFYVTLTQITMMQEDSEEVQVFSGDPVEINLVDLMGVSSVLSSVEVNAGTYNQIRLHIADPELYLVDDPETPITDIQLTANERLFVGGEFTVPEDQVSLLMLAFESMHLVEQGNGGYTLTPQLRADVSIVDAEILLEGEIVAVDTENEVLTVALPEGEIDVHFADAALYSSFDAYDALDEDATVDDLVDGAGIWVEGLLQVDGTVQADAIVLLN